MTYRLLLSCLTALVLTAMPAQAETVRWGRSGDAATLDPHAAADGMTRQLVRNIYEPLVEREPNGNVTGKLATSWLASADDPNVWVFNLRQASFHDGSSFDAEDVVFSFDRARADGSPMSERASTVTAVRAIDPRTVEIRFSEPSPALPALVSEILIMDKQWAVANGVAEAREPDAGAEAFSARHANGTGPYRLDSRDPDVRTKLVANDGYPGTGPAAEEIIYLPIVNPAMQATALLRGEIDVLQDVVPADIERFSEADGIDVEIAPANAVLYLGYRLDAANGGATPNPLSDPKVREAIDYAIDRADAAAMADHGHAQPTAILAPPFVNGWSRGLAVSVSSDPERAKKLMNEAGHGDGFAIDLDVANGDVAVVEQLESMLMAIGIDVTVAARPQPAHEARIASGESAFYLADYSAPGYDSAAILKWLVEGREGYQNAALAERINALSGIQNRNQRGRELAAIWLDAQKERIVLPIAQRMIAHAMRSAITVPVDPNNQTRFETIRFND